MVKLVFVDADEREAHVDAAAGESVMIAAIRNGVSGILGECGGSLACCTCHVYLDDDWIGRVGPVSDFENEMLDMTASPREDGSRLCCQIEVDEALEGMRLRLPPAQV